jgi:elongation factor G
MWLQVIILLDCKPSTCSGGIPMKSYPASRLRNVGLFGHGSSGKTSLSEAMLFNAKVVSRLGRVEEGNTVSDYEPDEIKRRMSINTSLLHLEWKDMKVNLLDTPGYMDFVGEVKSAMRVVDTAILVLDASSGVEIGTETCWAFADEMHMPRMLFVNKMERENANFRRTVDQARSLLSPAVIPIQLPIGEQSSFRGVVDLLSMKAYTFSTKRDGAYEVGAIPADLEQWVQEARDLLVEKVAEADDELLSKYIEGEPLTDEEITGGLRLGILKGQVVPALCGSALLNVAIQPLLDTIVELAPSPEAFGEVTATNLLDDREESFPVSPASPLLALVFKTTADPYVGKLTYFRVYSGSLRTDSHVLNPNKGKEERIGQVFYLQGKEQQPTPSIDAGDMGAVAKLQETSTGDTLCSIGRPLVLPGIKFPEPTYAAALYPKTKADLDKMSQALARILEEDPTLRVMRDPNTGETLLYGLGESHVQIAVEKMQRKFGVTLIPQLPKVPYKETIKAKVNAEYKHKKQTGGHGQYGHVFLEIEPLPDEEFRFEERIVGGVVPKQFIPAVEKGVREAMAEGVLAGYPMTNIKVVLYDGSYHPVDSSEMSFKIAAAQALKKGAAMAKPVILEPIMKLTVTVPDQFTGDIIGDLNAKRGRVLGMAPAGSGKTTIEALVPYAEVRRYATDLRSITQGRGTFHMTFSHYEEVPQHLTNQIIEQAKMEREKEKERV